MNREEMICRILDRTEPWDMLVVGGGATGGGIAVDATARGYNGKTKSWNHFSGWARGILTLPR